LLPTNIRAFAPHLSFSCYVELSAGFPVYSCSSVSQKEELDMGGWSG